jgi:hypothetical protein
MGEVIGIFLFVAAMAALAFANIWGLKRSGGTDRQTKDEAGNKAA